MPIDDPNFETYFCEAVAIADAADRAAYLKNVCGSNDGLLRELEELVAAHFQAGGFLGDADADARSTASTDSALGMTIGPYRLLEQIGEGGFGVVYMAEQQQPIHRRVALKILKPGMDTRQVVARFEAERQALALMAHPNIAQVFDAGETPNGRPYFVMELIDGISLTKYCDQERLSTRERLALFIQICDAVQHAHQKGIIHRDLKPSNILVGLDDGKPVPKIIDFGVAKATAPQLVELTKFTEVGQFVGTLEYMAPEQADVNNVDIDTRADIYSLGVVLYELLAGSPPFTAQQLRTSSLAELLRIIREVEPPKPSTRLSSSDELPSIAANRMLEPKRLTKLVHGELDWITMKCLEKERGRRYETASELARDLERYLAYEPIVAGPPSARYRLKKFIRRNRGSVIAASIVFSALVAGVVGTTWGLVQADTQRRLAEAEKKRAIEFRDKALDALRATTGTDVEKLIGAKSELGANERAYLQAIADRWKTFARQEGTDEQSLAIQAEGHYRVAFLWQKLGRRDEARAEFELARDLQKRLAREFPDVLGYKRDLAGTHSQLAMVFKELGMQDESWVECGLARDIRKRLFEDYRTVPAFQEDLATSHDALGALLAELKKWNEARAEYELARDLQERLAQQFPTDPAHKKHLALTHNNLGLILKALGKPDEARSEYELARDLRKSLADEFPNVSEYKSDLVNTHNNLGILLIELKKRDEARAEFELARDVRKQLADQFPSIRRYKVDLGMSYCNFGTFLQRDQPAESLEWFQKAIDVLSPIYKIETRDVAAKEYLRNSYWGRAASLNRLARYTEAITEWDTVIELSPPNGQPEPRACRAMSRHLNGQAAEAIAEVAELTKSPNWNSNWLYDFACVYAVASGKIADKSQEFAVRAMELLQTAVKAGYLDVAQIKKDTDLDALRNRADFQKLLAELEASKRTDKK